MDFVSNHWPVRYVSSGLLGVNTSFRSLSAKHWGTCIPQLLYRITATTKPFGGTEQNVNYVTVLSKAWWEYFSSLFKHC